MTTRSLDESGSFERQEALYERIKQKTKQASTEDKQANSRRPPGSRRAFGWLLALAALGAGCYGHWRWWYYVATAIWAGFNSRWLGTANGIEGQENLC
jgi:ferric-dicitrate binding protein FerR (iron transport regulator)